MGVRWLAVIDPMREHLAVARRTARDEAGFTVTEVAAKIKRGEQSVRRFEQGAGKWNPQTGLMVEAYAELTGVPAYELWAIALMDWEAAQASDAASGRDTEHDTTPQAGTSHKVPKQAQLGSRIPKPPVRQGQRRRKA